MNTSKTAVAVSIIQGKIASITGYCLSVLLCFALLGGILSMSEKGINAADISLFIFCVILLVLSFLSILKGRQIKKRIKRFRVYVSFISLKNMTLLKDLAASTECSVYFVKKDLRKMINKKYFIHALIDSNAGEIIIQGLPKIPQAQVSGAVCKFCGANGRIIDGKINECEYCGSIL